MSSPTLQSASTVNRRIIVIIIALVVLFGLPIGCTIVSSQGRYSGEEFSPDDFSRRTFTYNVDPYFGRVWSGKKYNDSSTRLDRQLTALKFIKPRIKKVKTWHLIQERSGFDTPNQIVPEECDARFLTKYLDLLDEGADNFWTVWNTDYPLLAPIFWPVVADLARDEMYLRIPEVMEFAMNWTEASKTKEFKQSLDRMVGEIYLDLGKIDLAQSRKVRAKYRLTKAIALLINDSEMNKAQDLLDSIEVLSEMTPDDGNSGTVDNQD